MRQLAFITLIAAVGCLAQEPAPAAAGSAAITVPAGTKIALRLTGPLASKTARVGDAVHAETAFPVTVANHVAIPSGTYLEGAIDQVFPRGRHAGFTIHFARLVLTNGYTVALSAATADTRAALLRTDGPTSASTATLAAPAGAMGFQNPPTVTQPSMPKNNMGLAIGLGAGITAAGVVAMVVMIGRGSYVNLRVGHRFEMVLAEPLALDAARVSDAVANPSPR